MKKNQIKKNTVRKKGGRGKKTAVTAMVRATCEVTAKQEWELIFARTAEEDVERETATAAVVTKAAEVENKNADEPLYFCSKK